VDDQKRDEEQACNSHENFLPVSTTDLRCDSRLRASDICDCRFALNRKVD
jgi:hypothetical protein